MSVSTTSTTTTTTTTTSSNSILNAKIKQLQAEIAPDKYNETDKVVAGRVYAYDDGTWQFSNINGYSKPCECRSQLGCSGSDEHFFYDSPESYLTRDGSVRFKVDSSMR